MRPALTFVCALVAMLAATAGLAHGASNADRAAASFRAMQREFLDRRADTYRETPRAAMRAHAWPYSQALAATIAMTTVPKEGRRYVTEASRRIHGLERYARSDGAYVATPGTRAVYYDDNEWIALELVRWWKLRHDPSALARAATLFGVVRRAWDGDKRHACSGGVFWTDAPGNDDRNTVTTATGALLAMKLYEATRDPTYVAWARRMLAWVERCMRAPDGLLWDHLDLDGNRDKTHWSYNQGTTIGANVLLYRSTGDRAALARAKQLTDASLVYFDRTPGGREPPYFRAIFFRNVLELAAVDGNKRYRAAVQAYADAAWKRSRLRGTSVFRFARSRPPTLLEQAAMVQIYAALTGAR